MEQFFSKIEGGGAKESLEAIAVLLKICFLSVIFY